MATLVAFLAYALASLCAEAKTRETPMEYAKIVFRDRANDRYESPPSFSYDATSDYVPRRYIRDSLERSAAMPYVPIAPVPYPAFAVPVVTPTGSIGTDELREKIDEGVERVKLGVDEKLANATESMSGKLKSAMDESVADKLRSVDASVADNVKSAREAMESKIEAANERVSGRLDEGLENVSRSVEGRVNEGVRHLNDRMGERMRQLEERLSASADVMRNSSDDKLARALDGHDRVRELLSDNSSLYYDNMRRLLNDSCSTTHDEILRRLNDTEAFRRRVDERLDELRRDRECTLDALLAKPVDESAIMSRLNCTRVVTPEEKKARDAELLSELELKIVVADEADPSKSKVVGLTPLVLARRIRGISGGMGGKGMVSVCYHNQPTAFTAEHPLAPNDSEAVRRMFNGTMDAAHAPSKGVNLDTPNYINALILELKNTQRDYVSLCVESSEPNEEYENPARCLNMIVKRKTP